MLSTGKKEVTKKRRSRKKGDATGSASAGKATTKPKE
jgi:hypothetical protein